MAGDETVATVACDLMAAGAFRTIAIAEGAGEVEKRCGLHFEDCFKARTAFLAGVDRSILEEDCGRSGEKREEFREKERCRKWLSSNVYRYCCRTMVRVRGN